MAERRFPLLPVLAVLIVAAGAFAGWMAVPRRIAFHGTTYDPVAPVDDFRLTDQDGRAVSLASFRGRPLLVFFGYTRCADFCPQTLGRLSRAVHSLGEDAGDARIVLVTVDPAHDTPAVLKRYVARFGPQVSALTGDSASLAAVWHAYGAYVAPKPAEPAMAMPHEHHPAPAPPAVPAQLIHSGVVYGIDRRGNLQVVISDGATEDETRDDIRTLAGL
ncbi:SCO family protein [Longimicrobium sp.]|uniref:SCO family protein n=1 Tax=Longimicrobium sp. TaxID=2029185 RepID=UPI002CECC833|nr:SCO family protein [Longimicrobium sp.]HSU15388.1 SCO family protein [Longimicrobium sp.]